MAGRSPWVIGVRSVSLFREGRADATRYSADLNRLALDRFISSRIHNPGFLGERVPSKVRFVRTGDFFISWMERHQPLPTSAGNAPVGRGDRERRRFSPINAALAAARSTGD
jgi:hypothetical protein